MHAFLSNPSDPPFPRIKHTFLVNLILQATQNVAAKVNQNLLEHSKSALFDKDYMSILINKIIKMHEILLNHAHVEDLAASDIAICLSVLTDFMNHENYKISLAALKSFHEIVNNLTSETVANLIHSDQILPILHTRLTLGHVDRDIKFSCLDLLSTVLIKFPDNQNLNHNSAKMLLTLFDNETICLKAIKTAKLAVKNLISKNANLTILESVNFELLAKFLRNKDSSLIKSTLDLLNLILVLDIKLGNHSKTPTSQIETMTSCVIPSIIRVYSNNDSNLLYSNTCLLFMILKNYPTDNPDFYNKIFVIIMKLLSGNDPNMVISGNSQGKIKEVLHALYVVVSKLRGKSCIQNIDFGKNVNNVSFARVIAIDLCLNNLLGAGLGL